MEPRVEPNPHPSKWHHCAGEAPHAVAGRVSLVSMVVSLAFVEFVGIYLSSSGKETRSTPAAAWAQAVLVFFILLAAISGIAKWLSTSVEGSNACKADLALLEDSGEDVWVVQLFIVVDHDVVGADRGVLGFQNGAAYFNGHGCSFQIGSQDLIPSPGGSSKRVAVGSLELPPHLIQLKHHRSRLLVAFQVLDHRSWNLHDREAALDRQLEVFAVGEPTIEERSYPPMKEPPRRKSLLE